MITFIAHNWKLLNPKQSEKLRQNVTESNPTALTSPAPIEMETSEDDDDHERNNTIIASDDELN